FNHALLDGWNKVAWNGTTDYLVLEFKSFPARQRRKLQPAIPVLTMPAGLLLIFSLRLCRRANGLAIRNLRHTQHHFCTVFSAQFFKRKIDMPLTHPA